MAAITDFISESIGPTTNQFFWLDNGEANTLKRALHGGSYSAIATVTGLSTYQDATASSGVFYDYKITSGISGDSNVSSVVCQVCDNLGAPTVGTVAGQYAQDQVTPTDFNNLVDDLNKALQSENSQSLPCECCPVNGAVVLDCGQCSNFIVNVTTDINSISMVGCENVGDGTIDLAIPAGTTPSVGGFPSQLGFDGGEGRKNPGRLTGGPSGVVHRLRFGGKSTGGGKRQLTSKGKTGGVPKGLPLTLVCQTSGGGTNSSCSMACASTKAMKVVASGGTPPYIFSVTGSLNVSTTGATATLTPPTNSGPGTAGVAYTKQLCFYTAACANCNAPNFGGNTGIGYKCDDTEFGAGGCGNAPGAAMAPCATPGNCLSTGTFCAGIAVPCEVTNGCNPQNPDSCTTIKNLGKVTDTRTGAMVTAGCNPCGVSVATKVVTVRDAAGAQVSKTIIA